MAIKFLFQQLITHRARARSSGILDSQAVRRQSERRLAAPHELKSLTR